MVVSHCCQADHGSRAFIQDMNNRRAFSEMKLPGAWGIGEAEFQLTKAGPGDLGPRASTSWHSCLGAGKVAKSISSQHTKETQIITISS